MSLVDILQSQLGSEGVEQIGRQLGLDPATAQQAVAGAIPILTGALARNASQPGGADALHQALDAHDGSIFDQLGGLLGNSGGNSGGGSLGGGIGGAILGHILGHKQDTAAGNLANATGISGSQAMQLLAMLAPLVMGALGRMRNQQGIDPGSLSNVLQNEHARAQAVGEAGGIGLGDVAGEVASGWRAGAGGCGLCRAVDWGGDCAVGAANEFRMAYGISSLRWSFTRHRGCSRSDGVVAGE